MIVILKHSLLSVSFFLFAFFAVAQPAILWEKTFGGAGNEDRCYNVINYKQSGYLITGKSNSLAVHGQEDAWLLQIDASGNIVWELSYGGNQKESFFHSVMDDNGNIYSVGYSAGATQQVSAGYGLKDVWVVKTDSTGTIIWEKSFGGTADEAGYDLAFGPDGSIIVAAVSYSTNGMINDHHGTGNRDLWLLRLNSLDGSIIWAKSFGGTYDEGFTISLNNISTRIVSIATQDDSSFVVSTITKSPIAGNNDQGTGDLWIFKIDIDGNLIRETSYGGALHDVPYRLKATTDNGFIMAGASRSVDGDVISHYGSTNYYDGWLVKFSDSLTIEWQLILGGTIYDELYDILIDDNGYYLVGRSSSANGNCWDNYGDFDYQVYFVDTNGIFIWSKNFGSAGYDEPFGIVRSVDGNFVVAGNTNGADQDVSINYGPMDVWVFEYSDISTISEKSELQNSPYIFPNPADGYIRINQKLMDITTPYDLELYDLTGKIVFIGKNVNPSEEVNLSEIVSGMYLYSIKCEESDFFKGKLILE